MKKSEKLKKERLGKHKKAEKLSRDKHLLKIIQLGLK
jgi:hypothetical protein